MRWSRVPAAGCAAALWLVAQGGPGLGSGGAMAASPSKECGNRICPPFTYCQDSTTVCQSCAHICNPEIPSKYESSVCQEQCQDYLMSLRIPSAEADGTARALGAVAIAIGGAALLFVLMLLGLLYCVYRRPQVLLNFLANAGSSLPAGHTGAKIRPASNNNKCDIERDPATAPVSTISSEALRLDMRAAAATPPPLAPHSRSLSHSPTTPLTTSTHLGPPAPARHPSEDSTLDYAYDNPALSPSPVMDKSGQPGQPGAQPANLLPGALTGSTPVHGGHGPANGAVPNRMESRI